MVSRKELRSMRLPRKRAALHAMVFVGGLVARAVVASLCGGLETSATVAWFLKR